MTYDQSVLNDYSVLSDPNDTLHRQVQTIVSSYNSAWDVLTELIQNSVDAVNMRGSRESPASGFQGIIYIPTVSLDAISLVASSCGYDRGYIEQHAAQ